MMKLFLFLLLPVQELLPCLSIFCIVVVILFLGLAGCRRGRETGFD